MPLVYRGTHLDEIVILNRDLARPNVVGPESNSASAIHERELGTALITGFHLSGLGSGRSAFHVIESADVPASGSNLNGKYHVF
jgi:hypothetical protein